VECKNPLSSYIYNQVGGEVFSKHLGLNISFDPLTPSINLCICSDNQAALCTLDELSPISKTINDCHKSLNKMEEQCNILA